MQLPLHVVRVGSQRTEQTAETRNVSANGVLFATYLPLTVGDILEYHITLPAPSGTATAPPLRCLGKVVRIHDEGNLPSVPRQVAVTLERYEFLRNGVH